MNKFQTFEQFIEFKEKLFKELQVQLKTNVARSQVESHFTECSINQTNIMTEKLKVTEEKKKLALSQEDLKKTQIAKQSMEEHYVALQKNYEEQKKNLEDTKVFFEKKTQEIKEQANKKHEEQIAQLNKKMKQIKNSAAVKALKAEEVKTNAQADIEIKRLRDQVDQQNAVIKKHQDSLKTPQKQPEEPSVLAKTWNLLTGKGWS